MWNILYGLLLSHSKKKKEEVNLAICSNVGGRRSYFLSEMRKTNTFRFHLYVDSKQQNK